MTGPASEVLELAALERLDRIGGAQFVLEMIDLFLEHAPQRLSAARRGLQTDRLEDVYLAAHSLKSTAANLGARQVQEIAERLEERARDEDRAAAEPLLVELEAAYEQLRGRLEGERRRRTGETERKGGS